MEIICDTCGYPFSSVEPDDSRTEWRCPICGSPAHRIDPTGVPANPIETELAGSAVRTMPDGDSLDSGDPTCKPAPHRTSAATSDRSNPADTVFQPALMMKSIIDELSPEEQDAQPPEASSTSTGTEWIAGKSELPSPFLDLETQPYLLILGARPGEERRPIVRARTSFGRKEADVNLADPSVSATHFQIEAFGSEFFVRDLESRNGTFVNNNRIRYSQLLPGDQITAGRTTVIFRLSDDAIGRD
jgi:hypothetical protein